MSKQGVDAPKPASELAMRVASAVVLIALALGMSVAGGIWFQLFMGFGAILVVREFAALARPSLDGVFGVAMIAAVALCTGLWFVAGALPSAIAATGAVLLLGFWQNWVHRKIWAATGAAYALLPAFSLAMLRGEDSPGLHAVLFVFTVVWAADTFAYFAGRLIGGPKLAPLISPKKTWAGFAGGLAGSVIAGLALLAALGYSLTHAAAFAALALSLCSQIGDLFESWIKRHFGKKDSGVLIPGHGGLLDRIDGLIFASIAALFAAIALGGSPFLPGSPGTALINALVLP